jgi:hypothetical protein
MGAFLVTCVVIAILIAGGIAISVRLHNTSIKGQRLSGSQRFYAAPRRYATDTNINLTDADPIYYSRKVLVILSVIVPLILVALSMIVIGIVINGIVR